MKKILLILILICLSLPVFADNLKQQEYENKYCNSLNMLSKDRLISYNIILLIYQDYHLYKLDNQSSTLYEDVIKAEDKYCSKLDNDSIAICGITKQLKRKIIKIGESDLNATFQNLNNKAFLDDLVEDKIIIDDKYIKLIDRDIINIILMLNTIK